MMRYPDIYNADELHNAFRHNLWPAVKVNEHWVAARPEGFASWRYRWKYAWMVFTGKADALMWTDQ